MRKMEGRMMVAVVAGRRMMGYRVLAAALLMATGLGACSPAPLPVPDNPAPIAAAPTIAVPDDELAVVVHKGDKVLAIYREGQVHKTFPVVLGRRPDGRKRFQGDMRTPEGLYRVTQKKLHPRWQFFISIDYPNMHDVHAYDRDSSAGLIPVISGETVPIGGGLGIHGNDRPSEQIDGRDWTRGCVAMRNRDVRELYTMVEVGTPILFVP